MTMIKLDGIDWLPVGTMYIEAFPLVEIDGMLIEVDSRGPSYFAFGPEHIPSTALDVTLAMATAHEWGKTEDYNGTVNIVRSPEGSLAEDDHGDHCCVGHFDRRGWRLA